MNVRKETLKNVGNDLVNALNTFAKLADDIEDAIKGGDDKTVDSSDKELAGRMSQMQAAMNVSYQQMPQCGSHPAMDISMWKMAQFIVFCRKAITDNPNPVVDGNGCTVPAQEVLDCFNALSSTAPSAGSHCTADLNMVWQNFRSFYLSYRKALISNYLNTACPANQGNSINPSNQYLRNIGYQPRFITISMDPGQINLGSDLQDLLNQGAGGNYQQAME